jgi:hypothetical protein
VRALQRRWRARAGALRVSAAVCTHDGARTLYNGERGIAFRADCGDRARCPAARQRWRSQMRERLALVSYQRTPDLWTFTARTADQDAQFRATQRRGEAPRDRGLLTKANLVDFNRGLERLVRAVERQSCRERQPGYARTRHAASLRKRFRSDRVARGRPGAALRIRVREVGELHGRVHAHAASDFDYLDKRWLQAVCFRCGLGFCEYERRESSELRRAAQFTGRAVRGRTIALYLSKYLSKQSDDAPWPWPRHARLVSAARGELPPRPTREGWSFTCSTVARVAIERLGAVAVDCDLAFYSRDADPTNRLRSPPAPGRRLTSSEK